MKKIKLDKLFVAVALIYLIFPVVLFVMGWVKFGIAIVVSGVFCIFGYKLYTVLTAEPVNLMNKNTARYWGMTAIISFIWTYMSGIGSFFIRTVIS